jgi:hypothetical protein
MALFAIWFARRNRPVPITNVQNRRQKEVGLVSSLQSVEKTSYSNKSQSRRQSLVQMKEKPYVVDYAALSRSLENPPYDYRGSDDGNGRVIDKEGKVLMESGKEIVISGAVVGPNREHVLVKGSEGKNFVLTPATGGKLKLPVYPPGANMFPLDWDWIGEQSLLGESGVERLGPDSKPVKTDDNVAESKLYVYDLKTQQLSEVALPDKFTHAVFGVMEVIPDGHVHLALEGSEYKSWCEITTP